MKIFKPKNLQSPEEKFGDDFIQLCIKYQIEAAFLMQKNKNGVIEFMTGGHTKTQNYLKLAVSDFNKKVNEKRRGFVDKKT